VLQLTVSIDGKFSMISIAIDALIFFLSAYYNAKKESRDFFGKWETPLYIVAGHWPQNSR
jgi:hypothetical protein